ncbi:MAG TPA: GTPase HflX [Clostridiales bacterium]|nr:GTPase HflX [Clostridiales bacterium]
MNANQNGEFVREGKQRAILVGLNVEEKDHFMPIEDSMKELQDLAETAGATVVHSIIQNRQRVDPAYYIGKGKAKEIKILCEELDAELVIFNDELSGAQLRNLEELIEAAVIDRTTLILDIFAQRAQSKEGKLQVELAQLQYRLPRLIGLGKSLSRTGGGIGTRGPGEQKLDIDRRHVLNRIRDIQNQIKDIKKNRETQRTKRKKSEIPIIALVGYTNSGKSTLMNQIMEMCGYPQEEKKVYAEDMLFATLDTAHRKIVFPNKEEAILIDTVGFVSKLPHTLIEAFKATLEEVQYADLLLHVVDATNQNHEMQIKVTQQVLKELNAENKPTILVFNKIDCLNASDGIGLPRGEMIAYVSALKKMGIEHLISKMEKILFQDMRRALLCIPYQRGDIDSYLCGKTDVKRKEYQADGVLIETKLRTADYQKYRDYIVERPENPFS